MFGFLKKKKKKTEELDARSVITHEPLFEGNEYEEEGGYFLSDRDIRVIINACVYLAKSNRGEENKAAIALIPEIGGKLRDKTDLSPDDITVISICLQAYNTEVSRLIVENYESPLAEKLGDEKAYFLVIIDKLTKYLTNPI